jgi:glycosyltransferase involved in cell wall biosynthesis
MKFGIVISTYKRKDGKTPFYLNRTLNSILNQTYSNYKVFLIGDKYDDLNEFYHFGEKFNTSNFYSENLFVAIERDKYTEKIDRTKLWCAGGCYASNYGIDLALNDNIEYICRLDHDDWWENKHLENFKFLIDNFEADWMCSKSTYVKGVLPNINSEEQIIKYLPTPYRLVKSSTCVNQKTIPIRSRDVFAKTGNVVPGDADLWDRMATYIHKNNLNSYLFNEITCNHTEEGYSKL